MILLGSIHLTKYFLPRFYSDLTTGSSITGATYKRQPFGPCQSGLLPVLKRMEKQGKVFLHKHTNAYSTREQKQVLAIEKANLNVFNVQDLDTINRVLDALKSCTGMEVSDMSHTHRCWQLAKDGEEIPYFTAHIADAQPRLAHSQRQWAEQVAASA